MTKVMTVVGTRPEIIRLSEVIKRLDTTVDHVLVHTGQNYDFELTDVFFEDLGLRPPDYFLNVNTSSLGGVLGEVLIKTEKVLLKERPDAFLILGDTNSCIGALMAKRMRIPVYHMEAGNRCFDEDVPEETNRRLIDHISDYNLVYTEHARRNLLAEGIHPSRILLTGSPMREVINRGIPQIEASDPLASLGLKREEYFLASLHREENVDDPDKLRSALDALEGVRQQYSLPVLMSTHPRTRKRLEALECDMPDVIFHSPFRYYDYVRLQKDARVVLSDSGTIAEESSMLGFRAVTLRVAIERPEAIDAGVILTAGLNRSSVLNAVELSIQLPKPSPEKGPDEYSIADTSQRVAMFILGTAHSHRARLGVRKAPSQ